MKLSTVRKNTWIAIVAFFLTYAFGISFVSVLVGESNKLRNQYPIELYPDGIPKEVLADWAKNVVPIILGLLFLAVIAGIVYLIFYIISIVNSYKFDDKTSFVLLIVGIFFGVVGIIGLFILVFAAKKEEHQQAEKQKQVDTSFG